jgi:hypothetical protein
MDAKPIPSVLAILLCDTCITDAATSKKTLIGLFDRFLYTELPITPPGFTLYAKLTDMDGQYAMRIDLVNLEDEQRLASFTLDLQASQNRLGIYDLLVMFPARLQFDRPGRYEFQLYADEIFVGRTTVTVEKREMPQ